MHCLTALKRKIRLIGDALSRLLSSPLLPPGMLRGKTRGIDFRVRSFHSFSSHLPLPCVYIFYNFHFTT
ncbi:hypothetical protein MPTK1_8g13320 [Marchantia polymorpha subsp. ruderalis]|uniref:Uncharacterized protein n=1 Tax=Marchantia polymorpha TaxID=3197 RepID=A0A2R6WCE2_MARPO|nr:hypothetical protein MARPO_0110s0013 [Marchantia polymorpha]BBN19753.1 hypothetical protein Mp_8g13320 [Marchantia polymorpha subsp. ruderalis]|eukprot:PTQ31520.1 hypothetical protein MARPO_0110s0013 [Marchantia polymorpha]